MEYKPPTSSLIFMLKEPSFARYHRALRRPDQIALDDLLNFTQQHTAQAGFDAHPLPMAIYLLSMLLEEHKQIQSLRKQIEQLLD